MSVKQLFERIDSIRIESVSKRYGDIYAVKDVDIEIEGGELLALIGPSGSGKTTTLRMINRLVEPDSGRIYINGTDITTYDPVSLRRNIGYVIQQIGLFPHMDVEKNIGLIPRLAGMDAADVHNRVATLLELVALPAEQFLHRYPSELSGGQQQRIGLARALAMDPPLLLMDEPFGALDPILRVQLQQEFAKIKTELDKTIVFVTHDIEESFALGDRVGIMKDASLVQMGTAKELLFSPRDTFVADIVGASAKYRHLPHVSARDVMVPIGGQYVFPEDRSVAEVRADMESRDIEFGIVMHNGAMVGTVRLLDLYRREGGERLGDVSREPVRVSPRDAIGPAMEHLKAADVHVGVVAEGDTLLGLLCIDTVMMEII